MGSGAIAGGEDEDERPGGRCSGAAPRSALSLCPGAATASSEVRNLRKKGKFCLIFFSKSFPALDMDFTPRPTAQPSLTRW